MKKNNNLNIYKIARETGVSIATVSRVLNNKPNVSPDTRRVVLDIIKQHNYVPKLHKNKKTTIGILLEYPGAIMTHYVAEVINGISESSFEYGFQISIFSGITKDVTSQGLLYYLRENDIDGVIILLSNDRSRYIYQLEEEKFPYIVINNRMDKDINFIDVDNKRGSAMAVRHLVEKGHKKIFCLPGDRNIHNFRERFKGFNDAMRKSKIKVPKNHTIGEVDRSVYSNHLTEGHERIKQYLSDNSGIKFTALCCASDDYAFGAIKALKEAGIKVPGDVSVVGFDDYEISSYFQPGLTTVKQPLAEMGRYAVVRLSKVLNLKRTNGHNIENEKHLQMVVKPELVVRESTASI